MTTRSLGDFEQLLLFAIVRLEDDAYGVSIRQELDRRASRSVSAGAVYTGGFRSPSHAYRHKWVADRRPERLFRIMKDSW